ncbi:MAG: CAP domain-containing protein [Lachnospiraceae bacterium]
MKNITNRRYLALVATMTAVLVMTGVLPAMNVQAADLKTDTTDNTETDVAIITDICTDTTYSVSSDVLANMNANAIVAGMDFAQRTFLSLYLDTNHAVIADNGTIVNSDGQIIAYVNNYGMIVSVGPEDYAKDLEWLWASSPDESHPAKLNRASAEEIWGYMNAERTEAGLNPIAWDEEIYSFACKRAQAIVTDFSHNGCEPYGENIASCPNSAYLMHMSWYNSPFGHHENYMNPNYTRGACAVYEYGGYIYGVENFTY